MSLDNAQWIAELSAADPQPDDLVGQGDDHIRTTKVVQVNTWVGNIGQSDVYDSVGGAVLVGPAELNSYPARVTELEDQLSGSGEPVTITDLTATDLTVTNPIAGDVTGSAATAVTVTAAAQPAITSLGTLDDLVVTGDLRILDDRIVTTGRGVSLGVTQGQIANKTANAGEDGDYGIIISGFGDIFEVAFGNRSQGIMGGFTSGSDFEIVGDFTSGGIIRSGVNDIRAGTFSTVGNTSGTTLNAGGLIELSTTNAGLHDMVRFVNDDNGGGQVGRIFTNGQETTYQTSSDPLLKTEFTEITNGLNLVVDAHDAGAIGEFGFLGHVDDKRWGYNAQWLGENQPHTGADVRTEKSVAGMDYGKRTPVLEAAIYELLQRIKVLEAG